MSPRKKEETRSNPRVRFAKEKKKNKLIVIGFIITAVLILGMIGYAILYTTVLKDNIPVAIIDGQKIDNEYYKARVRLERNSYIQQFQVLYAQYQIFAEDPNSADYYEQQLQQIVSTLDNVELFGEMVLNNMIDDEIIAIQGEEMGIEISESEIDVLVQKLFNYFPDGTPTPVTQPTVHATPTISKTQEAILSREVENGEDETDVGEETIIEPTSTTAAQTQTPGPTATPYTEEMFQAEYDQYLGELETINISETYLRKYIYYYLMNQKVRDAVTADVPFEQEQIWARHILVPTKEEAIIVVLRLEEEAWDDVAADVSLDTSNKGIGGDLGWFTRGQMVSEFEEAAFGMEIGQISDPIETQFGWHIVQLIDQDIRPLSQADYENKQNIYFDDWFTVIKENIDIKINDVWKDIVPDEPIIQ
jgi:parvulin-like peptidyl-prolyl isomerase